MKLEFRENKIDKMEEFAVSLKNFNKLLNLELYLNNNELEKLPAF